MSTDSIETNKISQCAKPNTNTDSHTMNRSSKRISPTQQPFDIEYYMILHTMLLNK